MRQFTAIIEFDPETEQYVGIVPGIPGAHTQAETIDDLRVNLKEVLELCLEEMPDLNGECDRYSLGIDSVIIKGISEND